MVPPSATLTDAIAVTANNGTITIAAIPDPSELLLQHEGPWQIQLHRNKDDNCLYLVLSSTGSTILKVRVANSLLNQKKDELQTVTAKNPTITESRKRKQKNNKKQKAQPDRYDWSKHKNRFDAMRKELHSKMADDKHGSETTTTRKMNKRRLRKKTNIDKRKIRQRKPKTSKKSKKKKEEAANSVVPLLASGGAAYVATKSQRGYNELSPMPKRYSKRAFIPRSPPSHPPVFRMADLRSPLAWERQRQALLQQTKQPSGVRVSFVSFTMPFRTTNGYFLTADGSSQADLNQLLKEGAFVYKSSGRGERKMARCERRLTSLILSRSVSTSASDPHSLPISPSSSAPLSLAPTSAPANERSIGCSIGYGECFVDGDQAIKSSPGEELGKVVEGSRTSSPTTSVIESPNRLNTLSQIQDWETDDDENWNNQQFVASNSKYHSTSSVGECSLWSYSCDEESNSGWLSRFRAKWIIRSSSIRMSE